MSSRGRSCFLAPKGPADAERRETEFVAGGVDGFDARQAKIPEQIGLEEGREEGAAGAVDVDGDVEARFGLKLVEGETDLVDRLELQSEGDAESDNDADGVFIATLEHFSRPEQQAVAFHGDFANIDVEVAAELVPADLDRAHDEVGRVSWVCPGRAAACASST